MKPTKKNIEKFRAEFQAKYIEELKKQYTDAEWRVLSNSLKFRDLPEAVDQAAMGVDMIKEE